MKKKLVNASTLVHLDEDVTIELSTHTSNVHLPTLFAVERWCRADDGIFRSRPFTGREPLLSDRKECLSPKWVVTNLWTPLYRQPCRVGATNLPPTGWEVWKDLSAALHVDPPNTQRFLSTSCWNQDRGPPTLTIDHGLSSKENPVRWVKNIAVVRAL